MHACKKKASLIFNAENRTYILRLYNYCTTMTMAFPVAVLVGLLLIVAATAAATDSSEPVKYFVFSEDCFDTFFLYYDFLNVPCLKFTISKALGYGIVAGAAMVKLPQILKIVMAKSAANISRLSVYTELLCNLWVGAYNVIEGNPFSTYGESVLISIQNGVIVLLLWTFATKKERPTATHILSVVAFFVAAAVAPVYLPEQHLPLLFTATMPLFSFSRLTQIWQNFKAGTTGNLAFLTLFMNFAGTAARVFTTIQEVDDPLILVNYLLNAVLNGVLLFQVIWYWNVNEDTTKKQQ